MISDSAFRTSGLTSIGLTLFSSVSPGQIANESHNTTLFSPSVEDKQNLYALDDEDVYRQYIDIEELCDELGELAVRPDKC